MEGRDGTEPVILLVDDSDSDIALLRQAFARAGMQRPLQVVRDGGRYLVLGHYCNAGPVSFNPHVITRKQLQVIGSWSSEPRHLKAAIEFLRRTDQQFPFHQMVTHRFTLDRCNEALATTASWQCAKSVIVPDAQ